MDTPQPVRDVLFRPELFRLVASHASLSEFLAWHATCRPIRSACEDILLMDFRKLLLFWCPDQFSASRFWDQMSITGSVAIGSIALAVLRLTTLNEMSNLHLVCPLPAMESWLGLAEDLGWMWCGKSGDFGVTVVRFVTSANTVVTFTGVDWCSPIRFVANSPESALITFVSSDGKWIRVFALAGNACQVFVMTKSFSIHALGVLRRSDRGPTDGLSIFGGRERRSSGMKKPPGLFLLFVIATPVWPLKRHSRICVDTMSILSLCDTPSLLHQVLCYLPFQSWIHLSNTNSTLDLCVRNCFFVDMCTRLLEFIPEDRISKFLALLRKTNSVIAGSLPLAMLRVLPWGPGMELIIYCPVESKERWSGRFHWLLSSESTAKAGSGLHSNGVIKLVFVNGPHVLNVLAKAPESALSTFLSATSLVTAYPRMTLNRQSLCLVITRDGHDIGGECLVGFSPVAFRQRMPSGYAGVRRWNDDLSMVFPWSGYLSDHSVLGGDFSWELGT
ncbi:hypothetical protein K435DRAFT_866095 [Dendrothele bispora CBS 962.96]|uniref:Uncharacterized protein n=1 Tax=Dendrothele bispora (strain CBS 962.96) TaxID=1314807 RepID=A0A4S8LIH3_DENBC|nr:hypothetical protein K435DRAFT_866095 [Dendrothele bispora CBS 962.96]